MDKETLSNYGWIVICVLVLAVMLALATPFGSYVSDAVKSTTQGLFDTNKNALNSTGLINIGDQSFSDGTGGSDGGNQTTEVKREAGSVIPDGATYTPNGGTTITGNGTNTFPDTPQTGDTYEEGDYVYKYNQHFRISSWESDTSQNGWGVRVKNTSKTTYGEIISEIAGKPANTMSYTFKNCTSLTTAPTIPNSVTDMSYTFKNCTSLTTVPAISSNVTNMHCTFDSCESLITTTITSNSVINMNGTFNGCKSLTAIQTIPSSVIHMNDTFRGCTSLTTAPAIPNSVTNMSYTFSGCTTLTTAPSVIPSSVTDMSYIFWNCTNLTGTIEINANPITGGCFYGTTKPIILTGSSTKLSQIAEGKSNITIQR